MLITLDDLVRKYGVELKGVLHVGAHLCEEIGEYEKYIKRDQVLWVEALASKVAESEALYPGILIEQAVVSDQAGLAVFHQANNGQSSSMLQLGLHRYFHPEICYVDSQPVYTSLLRDIIARRGVSFNFINLDIQGAELKALKGMAEYLPSVDYIYTEVNSDHVYIGCALVQELDAFLSEFGFERLETVWWGDAKWGDAFYMRKK
ncbi:MAG: FkbM family methyltransferase [Proteobacteria bacterium]|nr:FkbM family methyltransferase [Pseudomonadota bacterium]